MKILTSAAQPGDRGGPGVSAWGTSASWCHSGPWGHPPRAPGRHICQHDPGRSPGGCTCTQTLPCGCPNHHPRCVWRDPSPPHGWALSVGVKLGVWMIKGVRVCVCVCGRRLCVWRVLTHILQEFRWVCGQWKCVCVWLAVKSAVWKADRGTQHPPLLSLPCAAVSD